LTTPITGPTLLFDRRNCLFRVRPAVLSFTASGSVLFISQKRLVSSVAQTCPALTICSSLHWNRFGFPNARNVLGNCAIARELPGATNIDYGFPRPGLGLFVE